jgi:predicted ester cyclase
MSSEENKAFKRYPDLRVVIEDIIAEGDKVAVRNRWQATDPQTGIAMEFSDLARLGRETR